LKDPTHQISTIKSGNIQLDGGGRSNGRIGRWKSRRSKTSTKAMDLVRHLELERLLGNNEIVDGSSEIFNGMRGGHAQ
ncbi:hypothetical protein A2U01_0072465, partial [Trifolium medium]|nr:hypothetical protein [Trifolium medium]